MDFLVNLKRSGFICFSCDGNPDCPGSYPRDEQSCREDGTSLTAIAGSTVLFILLGICSVLLLVVILICYSRHLHARHHHEQQGSALKDGNDHQLQESSSTPTYMHHTCADSVKVHNDHVTDTLVDIEDTLQTTNFDIVKSNLTHDRNNEGQNVKETVLAS